MANKLQISTKRILIDRNNATMVGIIAAAAFVTVFSLFASRALLSQRAYQARVIGAKKKALNQLKANNKAATDLVNSYKAFVSPADNIIGGSTAGSGDKDGDNAKIILDALPSKYDFPAMVSSLAKILSNQSFQLVGISGTDDELAQANNTSATQPVPMPFQVTVTGTYDSAASLSDIFQRSIRPINISSISLQGDDNKLNIVVSASTYYQPEKTVQITSEVIK